MREDERRKQMLKFFRQKRIMKIIFWGLVTLILPAFVLLEMKGMWRSKEKGSNFVGTVDAEKISFEELSESTAGVRSQMILNYFGQPEVLDAFFKNKPLLTMLGWKRLVLLKEAEKYNIKILDKEVITYIRSHPLFSRNGNFDSRRYRHILRYNIGLSPRNFEEIVRGNLTIQKLKEILSKNVTVSEEEILREYKRDNEKIKISYILVANKDFLNKVNVGDKAIKDYYEKHKLEFMLPHGGEEAASGISNFEDVKDNIRTYLTENEMRSLSRKYALDIYKKILEAMEKENATFEGAAASASLKTIESPLFSKSDYIEGVGEGGSLIDIALTLTKPNQISNPIEAKDGIIIFKVSESTPIDEEKFKKEKDAYSEKLLEAKKLKKLDERFNEISPKSHLQIDFKDMEKYHK
ncbi:MAG: SurA N-terminal domain-containing protein [Candidatus Omnitrophica bacterium]|nr:SurA N-terminal domain-containing protein [Candidatus Omnitrophota bacterium]